MREAVRARFVASTGIERGRNLSEPSRVRSQSCMLAVLEILAEVVDALASWRLYVCIGPALLGAYCLHSAWPDATWTWFVSVPRGHHRLSSTSRPPTSTVRSRSAARKVRPGGWAVASLEPGLGIRPRIDVLGTAVVEVQ